MITPEQKQWIEESFCAAEDRFAQAVQEVALNRLNRVPATAQEAVRILKVIDDRLPAIEREDPAYAASLRRRAEVMWAGYVRSTDLAGLGACAGIVVSRTGHN